MLSNTEKRSEQFRDGLCHLEGHAHFKNFNHQCFEQDKTKKNVWLYGDSHAGQFYLALRKRLTPLNNTLTQTTLSGCAPWGKYHKKTPHCVENNNWITKQIIEKKPQILIIGSAKLDANSYRNSLDWIDSTFNKKGIEKILILGKMAQWSKPLPQLLVQIAMAEKTVLSRLSLEVPKILKQGNTFEYIFQLDKEIESYIKKKGYPFKYYSTTAALCSNDSGCITIHPRTGGLITFDKWHLTADGAELIFDDILNDQTFHKSLTKK